MIKNHIKLAWRNLLKSKFYSALTIAGLTIGLSIGLLILLWVNDELSFDRFHSKGKQLYRVSAQLGTGSSTQIWSGVQPPIAVFGMKSVPGIQNAVRLVSVWDYGVYRINDKMLKSGDYGSFYADSSFFNVFDFKLLRGDRNHPFPTINSVILTQRTAKRFFGDADPMGKTILAENKDNYVVAGIMADIPENSSIKFDLLFSIAVRGAQYDGKDYWKSMNTDWGDYYANTYLLLRPGTSPQAVADQLTRIHIENQPGEDASKVKYLLQPLSSVHLYKADGAPGGIQSVQLFSIVAVLILLIACINYINLSTARALLRSKEVSVRKIIGARKKQLFTQFVIETLLTFVIALAFALVLIRLLMPVYNEVSGKQLQFNLFDPGVWKVIGLTALATLAASSIYPAVLLSSFKPIAALKGKGSIGVGNAGFRKVLVVCQFIFSVVLIIGTLVIDKQLRYIRETELGYDRTFVMAFGMRDMQKDYAAVRSQLLSQPGISDVASAGDNIMSIGNTTGDTEWDGKDPKTSFLIHPIYVDRYFARFFKMKLAKGQFFQGLKTDSAHYILNETAVREAGITNPIGKRFKLHDQNGIIIGVMKDFHFASFKEKIEPAIFVYNEPKSYWQMYVRTTGKDAPLAIKAVQKIWKQYNPAFPLDYHFMDETYNEMYKADEHQAVLFNWFAGIAILISCLGLFGLATYTAQAKVKEIDVRKVLGASVSSITVMLAKDFLLLVVMAIIVATPIAWYAMHTWLQNYAYRITIGWWVFALSGILAILIALFTVSFQSIRAALANPVSSLRSE